MEYLILSAIGFIAALTPGPDIFYIIKMGIYRGRTSALLALVGILTGNLIYLTLVGLGVGVVAESQLFKALVSSFGAIYLLKIAISILKESPSDSKELDLKDNFNIFKEALLLNLSNPKAMLFFTVIITPFLEKSLILSLISLFLGISLAFLLTALLSSKALLKGQSSTIISKVLALIFIFFSFKLTILAYQSIKALL